MNPCDEPSTCACAPCRAITNGPAPGFRFTGRDGKAYHWSRAELDDTLLEGEAWDKTSVRKRIAALRPGQSMVIAGETLRRCSSTCSCAKPVSNGPRGGKKKRAVATDDTITVLESLEAAIVDSGDPDATRIFFDTDQQWQEAQAEVRRGYARVVNKTKHTLELQITERGYAALTQRNGPKRSRRWIADAIKHPGKLGGRGFLALPEAEQRRVLERCSHEYGSRSCLGSVMLLERIAPARHRARLARLHSYLAESHRRGYTPNPNPDDGSWDAIPIIIVPIDLRGATLTRAQVAELEQLTL